MFLQHCVTGATAQNSAQSTFKPEGTFVAVACVTCVMYMDRDMLKLR